MAGDYTKFQRHYGNLSTDFEVGSLSVNPTSVLIPRNVNYQVFIQSVELAVITYGGVIGIVKLIGHVTGRTYGVFNIPAVASGNNTDIYRLDHGPTGLGATIGEAIDVSWTNASLDCLLHFEAYNKLAVVTGAWDGSPATVASSKTTPTSNLLN